MTGAETVVACLGSGSGSLEEEGLGYRRAGVTSADQPVLLPATIGDNHAFFRDDVVLSNGADPERRKRLTAWLASKRFLASPEAQSTGVVVAGREIEASTRFAELVRELGCTVYLKEDDTVSGKAVYRISSEEDFERLRQDTSSPLTCWREVRGESINCHVLISDGGDVVPLLASRQLLGPGLRGERVRFEGNDFSWSMTCSQTTTESVHVAAIALGRAIHRKGFRGVCGMDMIVSAGLATIVDLNPRFQGSSLPVSIELETRGWPPIGLMHERLVRGDSLDSMISKSETVLTWPRGRCPAPMHMVLSNTNPFPVVSRRPTCDVVVSAGIEGWPYEGNADQLYESSRGSSTFLAMDLPRRNIPVLPGAMIARVCAYGFASHSGLQSSLVEWVRSLDLGKADGSCG